ncbi:MAG: 5-formyltetrahydrofolate cyclo-ligase [Azovibrio sp.]
MSAPMINRTQLRKTMISARRELPATTVAEWSGYIVQNLLQLFPTPPGKCIAFCWPIHQEPDVRAALMVWQDKGAQAALPVVTAQAQPLSFRLWNEHTHLQPDCYDIPTPVDGEWVCPDTLLLPLNAFDKAGYRLGYGGGFFDRTLAHLNPRPLAIGVGFEINRVNSIEPEPHDQRMNWIVTEAGVQQF